MDYPESFSNHPKSIAEIKSDKSRNAADWTPRDVLIDALRQIDSGEINADALIVVMREKKGPGETDTRWAMAGPDTHTSLGLLEYAQFRIMATGD